MSIHIALEHAGLDWKEHELRKFHNYWNEGLNYKEIARKLRRPQIDVIALALDQSDLEQLIDRFGGIFGNEWTSQSFKKSS